MINKRTAAVLLSVSLMLGCGCPAVFAESKKDDGKMPFLKACGSLIYDENNNPVTLRGTNLGGWLVWEAWMSPFTGADDSMGVIDKLYSRFGKEAADEIIKSFRDNYITETDFDTIKSMGFNCIRLPFWYQNLETGTDGEYDFTRLDFAVEMCKERGIYVILDCHGLPGFQSIAHHCGKTNDCRLYDKTEEGEHYRTESVKLWQAVAEHYKDNPVIAAYDLMNEPMCDFKENQDDEAMWSVYDLLYKAVREVDGKHIAIMEAIWDFTHLPDPAKYGWQNVMYELHSYDPTNDAYRTIIRNAKLRGYCVPIYDGEFHPSSEKAEWSYILNLFNNNNVSWTTWTYKGYCSWGSSDWFMYGTDDRSICVDLDNDSYETIMRKWGEKLRTENCRTMGPVDTFMEYAKEEYAVSVFDRLIAHIQQFIFDVKMKFFKLFR